MDVHREAVSARFRDVKRFACLLAALTALLVHAPSARAESWLGPIRYEPLHLMAVGPMFGAVFEPGETTLGMLGGEITYMRYPHSLDAKEVELGFGGFLQGSSVGFDHARFSTGAQVAYLFFGAELGATVELPGKDRAAAVGVHAAPFLSIGIVSFSVQVDLPVATLSEGSKPGVNVGLAGTLKWPFPVGERTWSTVVK